MRHTLSVHEVAHRHGVLASACDGLLVEHGIGVAVRASAHVLLAELSDLVLDGNRVLRMAAVSKHCWGDTG